MIVKQLKLSCYQYLVCDIFRYLQIPNICKYSLPALLFDLFVVSLLKIFYV